METVIGLDVGTSSIKGLLVDTDGVALASSESSYPLLRPRPGWSEQNPEDWWQGAVEVLQILAGAAAEIGSEPSAISLSGQMNGPVLLDKHLQPVLPCIIWADTRTASECAEIHERVSQDELIRITGKLAVTGYTAPKVLWQRRHLPDAFARTRHLLLPKDFICLRLTSELCTDASDASNTLFFDITERCWSDPILRELGISTEMLPPILSSTQRAGRLTREAAGLVGLRAGTPIIIGAGDSIAEAVGNGVVDPGPVLSVIGTAGDISASCREPIIDPLGRIHTGCHAEPNLWLLTGVQQAAGLSLRWLVDTLKLYDVGSGSLRGDAYQALADDAALVAAGAEGLIFLPYLTGERTPHLDPWARGVFFGIGTHHTRAHLARAVLEGIAFAQRDSLELLRELGLPALYLVSSGGGAKLPVWHQILADVSGLPVKVGDSGQGAAYGAAAIAAVGIGAYTSVEAASHAFAQLVPVAVPEPGLPGIYSRNYAFFKEIYARLRPVFASAFS